MTEFKIGDHVRVNERGHLYGKTQEPWGNGECSPGDEGIVTDTPDRWSVAGNYCVTWDKNGRRSAIRPESLTLVEPWVDIRDQILKSLDIKVPDRPFKVGDYVTVHEGVHDFTYGIDTPMPFNATIAEGPDLDDEYCVDDNSGESWYVTIDMLTHAERPAEPQQGSHQVQFQVIGAKADAEDIRQAVADAIGDHGLDLRTNTEVHVDNWIPSTKKWVDDDATAE